ncbi:MAG: rod shape-determining protein RodA, partial [Rectinemataceae bacterium]|nr:rod shape-determining protein RodA [Rectinemataceae bacterium]
MTTIRLPKFLTDMDFILLGATAALVAIGIVSIHSVGITAEGFLVSNEYLKQIIWAVSGSIMMIVVISIDYQRYKDYSFIIYVFFILLLLYTRFGGRVVNGARSWLGIGEIGIQPSEFAKIATILFLAQYLSSSEHENSFKRLTVSFGIIALPVLLILSQPDFGTSLVFFPILIFMAFVAGLDRKFIFFLLIFIGLTFIFLIMPLWETYILKAPARFAFIFYKSPYNFIVLGLSVVVLGLSGFGWLNFRKNYYFWIAYCSLLLAGALAVSVLAHKVLKEYQIMRLMVFLDPGIDPRGSGWNILQAITAIGSGGITGKGYLQGTQSHYRYIPQQSTDFIFSIVAEEWGFLGGTTVFALFYIILNRCVSLISTVKDHYASFVAAGVMGMLFFHFMINAGMVMGIMPITGIPLYFLSYGGSSLWAVLVSIGILL